MIRQVVCVALVFFLISSLVNCSASRISRRERGTSPSNVTNPHYTIGLVYLCDVPNFIRTKLSRDLSALGDQLGVYDLPALERQFGLTAEQLKRYFVSGRSEDREEGRALPDLLVGVWCQGMETKLKIIHTLLGKAFSRDLSDFAENGKNWLLDSHIGLISVQSEPSGVLVLLNGQVVGMTPLIYLLPSEKPHHLSWFRDGDVFETREIRLSDHHSTYRGARLNALNLGDSPEKRVDHEIESYGFGHVLLTTAFTLGVSIAVFLLPYFLIKKL